MTMRSHLRGFGCALSLALLSAAGSATAAPGDPLGTIANIGAGGQHDHWPYLAEVSVPQNMATLTGGNVVIAWSVRNSSAVPNSADGVDGSHWAGFVRVFDPNGAPVSAAIRPYADINANGTGRQRAPLVAALSGGGFVATWNSAGGPGDVYASGTFVGGDTYARVFDANGAAIGGTFKVNDSDADREEPIAVVGLTGGGFAIAWIDQNEGSGTNTDDVYLRVYNAAGTPQAASARLGGVAQDTFNKHLDAFSQLVESYTSNLVALSNGSVAVSWFAREGTGGTSADGGGEAAYVQVFGANGAAVSAATMPYSDSNPDGSGNQRYPMIAALTGGGFAVTWNSNRNTNDPAFVDQGADPVTTNAGGDTYARVFSNIGVAVSATTRVHVATGDTEEPRGIVALTGGGFAVVWLEDDLVPQAGDTANTDDFYVRTFNAAGTALGTGIPIGGTAADPYFKSFHGGRGIAALSDGGYVAGVQVRANGNTVTGTSMDGTGHASVVRVFNADGTARTAPFHPYLDINANGSGAQNLPELAQVNGGFAVLWNSAGNADDGGNNDVGAVGGSPASANGDVWTRLYDNAGAAQHATVRVATTEPRGVNDLQQPYFITRAGNNYIAAIHDENIVAAGAQDPAGTRDIFLRAFGNLVVATTPEIVVEQPSGTNVADGGSVAFGSTSIGIPVTRTFTIRNSGTSNLTVGAISFGGDPGYSVTTPPATPVTPGGNTTFVVTFQPSGAAGPRNGTMQIANNDSDENPFDVALVGTAVALPVLSINDTPVAEGGTATFTVSLSSPAPPGGVTFDIATAANTATSGIDYTAKSLTAQTIAVGNSSYSFTVDTIQDDYPETAETFFVNITSIGNATAGDTQGVGTINDNDTAGISVTPTAGLVTTEAGGSASFAVVLTARPTANVVVALASNDTSEGNVSPASLTFTTATWNTPQNATVVGVDDAVDDGDVAYAIVTGAATSTDTYFAGINPSDVAVTNQDNDTAGIVVTPTSGLVTTEAGGTATFTVVLTSQPTADVTVALATSDASEGSVAPASFVFNAANWNVARTATVTGVDDVLDDGDIAYQIQTASTSGDPIYAAINPADVSLTNTDDDTAGITLTPTGGNTTTEAGGSVTFTVRLDTQPTADVQLSGISDDLSEGTVTPTNVLTFTAADWNVPQTLIATGVDDSVDDGDVTWHASVGPVTSADPAYNNIAVAPLTLSNLDDDTANVSVTPTSGLVTSEAGGTATFSVVLESQPLTNVTIDVTSSDGSEGTPDAAQLVFVPANWNIAQQVIVGGIDDPVDDGDVAYTMQLAVAAGSDAGYVGALVPSVALSNTDDDSAGIVVTPTSGLSTNEAGGSASFTVVLASEPSGDVTIALSSSDITEGDVASGSLTFTPADWMMAQTVIVDGVDDLIDDGDVAYTIVLAPATSSDALYAGLDADDVGVVNVDDDGAGILVSPTAGLVTTEAGGSASFTVELTSEPVADVTIPLSSSDTGEGDIAIAALTFTAADWNVPQPVTVTGIDDDFDDDDVAYAIVTGAATSADPVYAGLDALDVAVTNSDDDSAGILASPTSGLVTSEAGGSATFTVVLGSEPTADVAIDVSSSDGSEATVTPATLLFTAANWNIAQTVTVTGVDDAVVDGDIGYDIVTAAAVSADPGYAGIDAADVSLSNSDDDSAGIVVTPTAGLTTTEAGDAATFGVVLTSEPTADVSIGVTSSDPGEGSVSTAMLQFTAANWNVAQTVTVTGIDDALDDGDIAYTVLLAAAVSGDTNYAGIDPDDVALSNTDDDGAGILVTPTAGLVTTEAGGTATFTVVLSSQPTANVGIGLSSSDGSEGSVAPAALSFTSGNWNVAQTVTVTGIDDAEDDGDIAYSVITAAATSADAAYAGLDAADVLVSNSDDDGAGIVVAPTAGLVTSEAGGSATFTVVLASAPTADVTIPLSSSDIGEGTVAPAALTFTSGNWQTPQTATVTGVDDALDDGDVAYTIVTGAATSADASYSGVDAADVAVTNTDDDGTGGSTVTTPTGGLETTEAGGSATFTVVLGSEPTADVTLPLSSSDAGEGTVSPASLVFTPLNWQTPQTVTVTGVDDVSLDGDIAYTIVRGAAVSTDPAYAGVAGASVGVTNRDDDVDRYDGNSATGTGVASIVIAGGGCSLDLAQTAFDDTAGLELPAAVTFPHGALRFRAQGCVPGTALTVEVTWPSGDADASLWKLDASDTPSVIAATALSPTTYRYTVVDGGALDADGAVDGIIVDPVALGIGEGTVVPPTANEPRVIPASDTITRILLMLMLGTFGVLALRRRG